MKYLEELSPGVMFCYSSEYWILTTDFKRNGSRMCISIKDGFPSWLASDVAVEEIDGYMIDNNSNLIKLRNHENTQPNNIQT